MANNIQSKINKLLTAIRLQRIDIKVDTIEFYSEAAEKYCKSYKVYIKEWTTNRYGKSVRKYIFRNDFTNKIELLKYLVDMYNGIKEGEADGR